MHLNLVRGSVIAGAITCIFLAVWLFMNFPETSIDMRKYNVWVAGMLLSGFLGIVCSVMPVIMMVILFIRGDAGRLLFSLWLSGLSLSMAAVIYMLRLFSDIIISPLLFIFLFLFFLNICFLKQGYIYVLRKEK